MKKNVQILDKFLILFLVCHLEEVLEKLLIIDLDKCAIIERSETSNKVLRIWPLAEIEDMQALSEQLCAVLGDSGFSAAGVGHEQAWLVKKQAGNKFFNQLRWIICIDYWIYSDASPLKMVSWYLV